MNSTRRQLLAGATVTFAALSVRRSWAQSALQAAQDRVFICNEDSNTLAVIDPNSNTVVHTVNLTSFDEDPRPPFRLVTGGVTPTHLAMVRKPLYHGAIDIHGAAPSPDNSLIATTGRGTSNVYLIDAASLRVIGNVPNAQASDTTNKESLTSGLLVGREPHEPTFTRNGTELWVTVRGEGRIAIFDVAAAKAGQTTERALRGYLDTLKGPAQAWFSKDGNVAFVASQKLSQVDVFETNFGGDGHSRPKRLKTVDIKAQDPRAFTPFLKTSPDGQEVWFSHKLADAVSGWSADPELRPLDTVALGENARPNHVEFVENTRAKPSTSVLREWMTAAREMLHRAALPSSIDPARWAAGKWRTSFSLWGAKRMASGQILRARACIPRMNKTNCQTRRMVAKRFAPHSMFRILSSHSLSRKSR